MDGLVSFSKEATIFISSELHFYAGIVFLRYMNMYWGREVGLWLLSAKGCGGGWGETFPGARQGFGRGPVIAFAL